MRFAPGALLATLASALLAGPAHAAPPGRVIYQKPELAAPAHHVSRTLYLNRCVGGCTISPGSDNSVANTSSILPRTSTFTEFKHSDEVWDRMVDCVRFVYAPYDIEIVTDDPSPAPHFEEVVAGTDDEGGFQPAGGVGTGGCGSVVDNSISYTFANDAPADPTLLCYVVAQETGHNFGMDHALEPSDPMTYLPYDGVHLFQDQAVDCGEETPRSCCAGPAQQNSHQYLLGVFGPGTGEAAPIAIKRPPADKTVAPGFAIEVTAGVYVKSVVVKLDGETLFDTTLKPFIFDAPDDLGPGSYELEVAATDVRGEVKTARRTVSVGQAPDGGSGEGDVEGGLCQAGGSSGLGGLSLIGLAAALAGRRRRRRRRRRR